MGASSNPLMAGVPALKPPSATQTMISPDGQYGEVPVDKVQDAIKAGFKAGLNMLAPDGTPGTVPVDKAHDALAAGFKPSGLTLPESKLYAQHPANVLYRNIRQNESPEQIAARQSTAQNVSGNLATAGNTAAIAGGLVAAPIPTIAGLAAGTIGQYAGTKTAKALGVDDTTAGQIGDVTGLVTGAAGGHFAEGLKLPGVAAATEGATNLTERFLPPKFKPSNVIREVTGTTPERISELQGITDKVSDAHNVAVQAEAAAKAQAKAAYPEINTPVKVGPPVPEAAPFDPTATIGAEQKTIPFKTAQEQYSQLALDARAAHVARLRGLITGFDEAEILAKKNALGAAMKDAAEADGKGDEYAAAQNGFRTFMNDFHNKGSAVEPLLEMNPSDSTRIVNHFLNPDKGARAIETLKNYGADTTPIEDLLSRGATPLKIDVAEAAKLRKVGPAAYGQQRLQESLDQATYNRMPSGAQARLPAWAMRKTSDIPLLPDFLQPNIPTRAITRQVLGTDLAKKAVIPTDFRQNLSDNQDMSDPETRLGAATHEAGHAVIGEMLRPGSIQEVGLDQGGGYTNANTPQGKTNTNQLTPEEIKNLVAVSYAGGMTEPGGTTAQHSSADQSRRADILMGSATSPLSNLARIATGHTIGPDPMLQANQYQAEAKARVNALLADPNVRAKIDSLATMLNVNGKLTGDQVRAVVRGGKR